MFFEDNINGYLDYCTSVKKLSARTVKAYRLDLCVAVKFLSDRYLDETALNDYADMLDKKHPESTARRMKISLQNYLKYLRKLGVIPKVFFQYGFTHHPVKSSPPKALSRKDVQKILDTVHELANRLDLSPSQRISSIRDVVILELIISVGMRVDELVNLRVGDVDMTHLP